MQLMAALAPPEAGTNAMLTLRFEQEHRELYFCLARLVCQYLGSLKESTVPLPQRWKLRCFSMLATVCRRARGMCANTVAEVLMSGTRVS